MSFSIPTLPMDYFVCPRCEAHASNTTSTPYRFSMQGHHVMFFFYVSWCAESLCEEVVQLLMHGMLVCVWSRTRIQLLWTKSHGARLYSHQADLLDRRRIYCHSITRDSESGREGCRDCGEGVREPNLTSGNVCRFVQLRREEVQVGHPQVSQV